MPAVTATGLTRTFGTLTAIDGLDLQLPSEGVVGLVGPNGSGKSTLIRMLLGLIRPTSGTAKVLGHGIESPEAYAAQIGALIESPAFLPALSARSNLASLAALRGLPRARVDEVLEVVGLTGRGDEPVRRFSLGMKQRLGIAGALLPDPRLIVLDEPTNGLDPAGIVEVRALLRSLGSSGRTVVVSSHLLAEIETICSYVVVIRFGLLVFAGPIDELMRHAVTYVDVSPEHEGDLEPLHRSLVSAGWEVAVQDGQARVTADADAAAEINRRAAASGVTLKRLTVSTESLEAIFLTMTGSTDGELAAARSAAAKGQAADGGVR